MKHRILMVDDEANVLKALKRLFFDTDYKLFTAESGARGLEICQEEEIDLVISDYRMPEMTGVQFLSKVMELHPHTMRIILSGYADVSAIVEAINDGHVYKFLSKPWNDQDLLTTVQRSLEHFDLLNENRSLLDNLKAANSELQKLTDNLELQIEDRTRDLASKNRALETTQRLLNMVPAGIIGIDDQGSLVYVNDAMHNHIDTGQLVIGSQIGDLSDLGPLRSLKTARDEDRVVCTEPGGYEGLRVVCAPLPDKAGVVGLFCHEDVCRYGQDAAPEDLKVEVTDG